MRLPDALPELTGGWLTAYKILWFTILVLAIGGITIGNWLIYTRGTAIDMAIYGAGIRVERENDTVKVAPISPEARSAGIVTGSVLLAVDGQPVKTTINDRTAQDDLVKLAQKLEGMPGEPVTLTLREPDGATASHQVTRGPQHLAAADREAPLSYAFRTRLDTLFNLVGEIALLAGAILIFRRRKNEPVAALLSLGFLMMSSAEASELFAMVMPRDLAGHIFATLTIPSVLLALATFPSGKFEPRWTLAVLPLLAAILLMTWLGDALGDAGANLRQVVTLFALAVAVGATIVRFRRLPPGPQRQQIKWAVLGFAGFLGCYALSILITYVDSQVSDTWEHYALLLGGNLLVYAAILSLVGGVLISLLRHRLYDADAAIGRSALYGALTLLMVAIFAASEEMLENIGSEYFGASTGAAASALAAGVAALLLVPLHHRLSDWTERRFQRDLARMRAQFPELLAELRDSSDPRELADDALRLVIHGVRARSGAILLGQGRKQVVADARGPNSESLARCLADELPTSPETGLQIVRESDFPARLPLLTPGGEMAGWLLLGPHPDGSLYGKDDREALEELASPLARALCLANERARREAVLLNRQRALQEQVDRIESKVSELADLLNPSREAGAA